MAVRLFLRAVEFLYRFLSLKFPGQLTRLEFSVWRDHCGRPPANFWWALGASLLLHLFLLQLGLAFDRPDDARGLGGIVLHVNLPERGVALEVISASADDAGETSRPIDAAVEAPVETVGATAIPASREMLLTDDGRRRSRQGPEIPAAFQDIPVADSARYFRRSELTRPPLLLGEPVINVPDGGGKETQRGGKLSLRLFVSVSGELDRAEIDDMAANSDMDDAVVAAFLLLHFRPGEIDGTAVNSQVVFEIDFDSQVRGSSRSSDQPRWGGAP